MVLHARNGKRADDARRALPRAEEVVTGDLETIAGAKDVAAQVNGLGRFDAVIHNAAVGYRDASPSSPPTGCRMSSRSTRSPPTSSRP